jgi:hypothetical protein
VDGRADLYGDDLLHQFQQAIQLRDGWKQVLDRWGVEAVLVPPSGALAQGLLLDDRWHAEIQDSRAILFLATPRLTRSGRLSGILPSRAQHEKMCTRPFGICETTRN